MKNNKGMTIVEIIVSISLISIILVFLLNLLITVKNYSDKTQSASELLINQAIITREIENDFLNYKLIGVSACTDSDFEKQGIYRPVPLGAKTDSIYCLKLTYDNSDISDNVGYLVEFNYNYSDSTYKSVVGYRRGTNQVLRESLIVMDPVNYPGTVVSSCSTVTNDKCSLKITLPVMGNDANNYDIELTYIYTYNEFTYSKVTNKYGFTIS